VKKRFVRRNALIPALAADLARQLEGHEADPALADAVREVQALYKKGFEPITAERFENLLRLVARGASSQFRRKQIVVKGSGVLPATLHKYLANPELRTRFEAARRHWRIYRGWSVLDVDEILEALANGDRTLQSVVYSRGMNRAQYLRLHRLIERAPEIEQQYHLAKRTQMARIGDRLLEEIGEVSSRKEAREISRRMDLVRRRMPRKIREVFHRERRPLERARRAAGLRLNGKPKRVQVEEES
jgi:hypothetical protein